MPFTPIKKHDSRLRSTVKRLDDNLDAIKTSFDNIESNYDLKTHTHTESEITDLKTYSEAGHTHTEAEITDLGSYAAAEHTHTALADIGISGASWSGILTGLTTLQAVLDAIDAHTHS